MIKYEKGDVLNSKAKVIAHGVNCKGAFGAGIAGQIRTIYPEVYRAYLTKHIDEGWKIGDCQIVDLIDNTHKIANLATQYGYGYANNQKVFVNYDALRNAIALLFKYCINQNLSVAMPRIGAGLAGGNWDYIKEIIEEEASKYPNLDITVYSI